MRWWCDVFKENDDNECGAREKWNKNKIFHQITLNKREVGSGTAQRKKRKGFCELSSSALWCEKFHAIFQFRISKQHLGLSRATRDDDVVNGVQQIIWKKAREREEQHNTENWSVGGWRRWNDDNIVDSSRWNGEIKELTSWIVEIIFRFRHLPYVSRMLDMWAIYEVGESFVMRREHEWDETGTFDDVKLPPTLLQRCSEKCAIYQVDFSFQFPFQLFKVLNHQFRRLFSHPKKLWWKGWSAHERETELKIKIEIVGASEVINFLLFAIFYCWFWVYSTSFSALCDELDLAVPVSGRIRAISKLLTFL